MTQQRRAGDRRPSGRQAREVPVEQRGSLRRWLLPSILGVVTVLVLVLYFTPLLGVRSVRVEGNSTLREPEVLAAAQVQAGKPMLQVDVAEIRARLERVPKVASARVDLTWPSEVRLEVTERTPVAFVLSSKGIELLDAGGVPYETVQQPPPGLLELRVRTPGAGDTATRAAMLVLNSLSADVREQALVVIATNPNDIRLLLKGNREVQWGSHRDSARKAAILPPLLTRPGTVYDVISPELPTVS